MDDSANQSRQTGEPTLGSAARMMARIESERLAREEAAAARDPQPTPRRPGLLGGLVDQLGKQISGKGRRVEPMSDRDRALAALGGTLPGKTRRRRTEPSAPRAPKSAEPAEPKPVKVVVTPNQFDHRVDRIGRPYAWIRGDVTKRTKAKERTVMAQGEAYHLVQHLLEIGAAIEINAVPERIVDRDTGAKGGEFYRLLNVLKVFDAEGREIDGSTGRVLATHDREGHYRRQHHGPNNEFVKIVWIDDTTVNPGPEVMRTSQTRPAPAAESPIEERFALEVASRYASRPHVELMRALPELWSEKGAPKDRDAAFLAIATGARNLAKRHMAGPDMGLEPAHAREAKERALVMALSTDRNHLGVVDGTTLSNSLRQHGIEQAAMMRRELGSGSASQPSRPAPQPTRETVVQRPVRATAAAIAAQRAGPSR